VFQEPTQDSAHTIAIIDFDDYREQKIFGVRALRGVKMVVLANEADGLELGPDEIAPLSGLLTHDLSVDAFVRSLRLIGAGERVFPPDMARDQNSPVLSRGPAPRSDALRLLPRERQMLLYVLEGHSNAVMARHLGVTEATVKVHLKRLLDKIKVDNRTQAAIWALANLAGFSDTPRGFVRAAELQSVS